jgi:HNH endonuclease
MVSLFGWNVSRLRELAGTGVVAPKPDTETAVTFQTKRRIRLSNAVMAEVWIRDGGRCVQCGSQEDLEFDHVIPFSKGGSSTPENLRILCRSCNRGRGARIG